jgi:hypothetical protein
MRSLLLPAVLVLTACASRVETPPVAADSPPTRVPPAADIPIPSRAYNATTDGFVVHEWGTLTAVVGSDGSTQPGLHHEEEDLPAFVADRMKQSNLASSVWPVHAKMETPVTYFYSPTPRTVTASVAFPTGVFTQWYPNVTRFAPGIAKFPDGALVDRTMQSLDLIPARCTSMWTFNNGLLDWGTVEILGGDASPAFPGPLGNTTWGFARNVAANAIRVGGQDEKFLFYRGLGNYNYPVRIGFEGDRLRLTTTESIAHAFVMNVTKDAAGFTEQDDLSAASAIPNANLNHNQFVATLKAKLAARLVDDGLYTDEALSMVDTWERSYFLTPGVRVLYLLPQARTDALIPLTIAPAPSVMKRTMVIRVEVMTPALEAELAGSLTQLAAGSTDARQNFLAHGRFAEPHLTRAVALTSSDAERAAGEALLTEIRKQRRWAPTAAE